MTISGLHTPSLDRPIHSGAACLLTLILLVSTLTGAKSLAGEGDFPDPKRATVPKLQGDLTIDGKLTEDVWKQAVVLGPFVRNDGQREGRERTEVRLWYDDAALHIGWICQDSDIQATFKERDSRFWEEEVAEFFVTAGGLEEYFELQWNPLGGVFDAIIHNQLDERGRSKKFEGDWSYTAESMKSAVTVEGTVSQSDDSDESWQVEVTVPFADLRQETPRPGAVWRANFYRFNRDQDHEVELLSWSPTLLPSFHQPSRFGFLEFGGEN